MSQCNVRRGKGDYYRLGHGTDDHVRCPRLVEALAESKVVSVAVGSLHCIACTEEGDVYTWGDNDEGQVSLKYISSWLERKAVACQVAELPSEASCYEKKAKFSKLGNCLV